MNRPVNPTPGEEEEKEGEEKQGLGNVQTKSFCLKFKTAGNDNAVSKITYIILCLGKCCFKADTNI